MIHALSLSLFGHSIALPDFPLKPDIRGIGMSDWDGYAIPLAKKFGYENTFYHQEPKLDITAVDQGLAEHYDFIISSDVFEHVAPPISTAFANLFFLLKRGGVIAFSVPYTLQSETLEHFPNLHRFSVEENGAGGYRLVNHTAEGQREEFTQLTFHGGPGSTLEMRVFSEASLMSALSKAGFVDITLLNAPYFEHGIYWPHGWSLPLYARKP